MYKAVNGYRDEVFIFSTESVDCCSFTSSDVSDLRALTLGTTRTR